MILRTLTILTVMILAFSCTGIKVVTENNKDADFSGYTTYSFLGWQDVSDEIISKKDLKLMKDSFISEFERRGLKLVNANPDMQVSCYLVTSTKTAYSGYNDYIGGRSSGYNHYNTGWGYGPSGNTSKQRSKLVGTLIMNVYQGNSKNQIWQATATGKVNDNPKKDRSKTLPGKVSSVMRKFPVRPK